MSRAAWSKSTLIAVCLILATGVGWVSCGQRHRARPNVVLFIIDTLRADALGCYGAELEVSPELDALASRGVRFDNVYAQNSWTRPSIGSMLTGRYPRSLGIYTEQEGILGDEFTTLAEVLREGGYTTLGITANPHLNTSYNFHQGFDRYVDSDAVYSFMQRGTEQTDYRASTVMTAPEMFRQVRELVSKTETEPVYVQMNLMDVHEWTRGEHDLTRPEYDSLFDDVPFAAYYRPLRQLSADLGAFVEELRSIPGWADTLFIFVSDHGEGLGSHPDVEKSTWHGRLLYESQIRVPLFLYREGWKFAGTLVEQPVRLLDLMPTVLEVLSLPVPQGLDGVSVTPALRDPRTRLPLPDYFVAETELRGHKKAAVYGIHWKYFEHDDDHPGTAPRELQAMRVMEDGIRTNRIAADPGTAEAMAVFLEDWRKRYPKAPVPPHKQQLSREELDQLEAIGYLQ
jgi:arylsulfatase A-like enzyme